MPTNKETPEVVTLSFVQQQTLLEEALRSSDDIVNAVDEVKRELVVRDRVYPRWVESGNLTRLQAKQQYNGLKMALGFLELLQALRQAMPGLVPTQSEQDDMPF